jgi:NAD(P)-dependent dehydrogenase (short-subunit alcohol dehydrogenase family)
MMSLLGKTAIITGAAQGIGARLATGMAKAGANVVIADVLDGFAVADSIRNSGGQAIAVTTDVTDDESLESMIAQTGQAFGDVDVLVNNAALFGTLVSAPFDELDYDEWDRVMRVNVRGVLQCSKAVLAGMVRRSGGSIVNISTNRIYKGFPNLLHYDASKGAVAAMTKSMAAELGDRNIRVNAIAPGLTMSENVQAKSGIEERNELVVKGRALKRSQQPEDLMGAVMFFASDDSSFISGQTLIVDGGGIVL